MIDGRNSVMETAKVYSPYLDVLKGIANLLMVMGHVIPWTLDKSFIHQPVLSLSGNEFYLSLVYKIIYSFHMPLFFCLWLLLVEIPWKYICYILFSL